MTNWKTILVSWKYISLADFHQFFAKSFCAIENRNFPDWEDAAYWHSGTILITLFPVGDLILTAKVSEKRSQVWLIQVERTFVIFSGGKL